MPKRPPNDAYERQKARVAGHDRAESAAGRDIGELPAVVNAERRNRGLDDPEFFHRTYFPNRFFWPFGRPHKDAIRTLAECTEKGGLFAFAMMRGGGKSALAEAETIRAIVYGLRRFVVFIAAKDEFADGSGKKILSEFESNPLLNEDFPEVCYPIRMLERINQRCKGQTLGGEPTLMSLTDGRIVLPTVKGSVSSGAVIRGFGLTGAIRGVSELTASGEIIRPDLAIIDDAQTRESAGSPSQTREREDTITADVMGLAGPQTKMAAVFLCTPIFEDDLTERFIDRDRHPEWQGVRTRMVEKFPTNQEWWDNYAELRRNGLRDGDKGRAADELYRRERAVADAGCVLAWPDRVREGEQSAVQTAMNLQIANPAGFKSEYQCEPETVELARGSKELVPADVAKRVNGVDRLEVPAECSRVTAFIDVGTSLLFYTVCAWTERFGGAVIDYGTWPRQKRSVFAANDPRPSLLDEFPLLDPSERVFAGLKALIPEVFGRAYFIQNGGAEMRVDRGLIDAGDGNVSLAVHQAIAASEYAGLIYASKGYGRTDDRAGVGGWATRPGERSGHHWRLTVGKGTFGRVVMFDPDAWKSFTHTALTTPEGGKTGLRLFGKKASAHELFTEHLAAEYSEPKKHRGDTFDKWKERAGKDNHWLDCLVGCAVGASVAGVTMTATADLVPPKEPKKRRTLAEYYGRAGK